jgi:hypothetical protein
MADYYSILARAVSRLETNNAQVRQELYEYTRAILNAHFDRSDPQISALGVIDERVEFETAILRVEAESRAVVLRPAAMELLIFGLAAETFPERRRLATGAGADFDAGFFFFFVSVASKPRIITLSQHPSI